MSRNTTKEHVLFSFVFVFTRLAPSMFLQSEGRSLRLFSTPQSIRLVRIQRGVRGGGSGWRKDRQNSTNHMSHNRQNYKQEIRRERHRNQEMMFTHSPSTLCSQLGAGRRWRGGSSERLKLFMCQRPRTNYPSNAEEE